MTSPMEGQITSGFGFRRNPITGKQAFHNGVDIGVPVGTPILAPENGTICEKWESEKGGLSLALITNEGIRYGFGHLKECLASIGDQVAEGDKIALSGNSGQSTGPHVHFTVKIHGIAVDPMKYFTFKK